MYIDASAIIEIGKVIGAIMVICGLPISIYNGIPGRMNRMWRLRR